MSRTLRRHARCLAIDVFSLDGCELAQSAILNQGSYLLAALRLTQGGEPVEPRPKRFTHRALHRE
jgi:hypothetical protein